MAIGFGDGSGTPIPTDSGERGLALGGSFKGRLSDGTINNLIVIMLGGVCVHNDSDEVKMPTGGGRCTMDANRQLFSTSGSKFNVQFNAQPNTFIMEHLTTEEIKLGLQRNRWYRRWIILNWIEKRQPSGNVINANGSTDANDL